MGFIPFSFVDLIDIFLVATLMYGIYRATKGTNAPYILSGIIFIYLSWVVVRALNMELLSGILGQIISVGVIALLIVFQPEIRRFLLMIGLRQKELGFIARIFGQQQQSDLDMAPIAAACRDMAETRTGALIVISRQNPLTLIVEGGIRIDAALSQSLLKNIFFKNAPLHDGAVVIENNRIVAAKCILPVTQSPVPKAYGTRHRSAIGMSEISDAIIIVVSEETGGISIAHRGQLKRNIDPGKLAQTVMKYIDSDNRRAAREKESGENRDKERERKERHHRRHGRKEHKESRESKDSREVKDSAAPNDSVESRSEAPADAGRD